MHDEQEPHGSRRAAASEVGRHALGPHVVGQRVVVRRLLPGETGPSGGPAMTDLLGTCTAWRDDALVVDPDDGPPVVIPLALVVSGKPVPPRPPVRLRVEPATAQRRAGALFPDLESAPLGDWLLRRSPTSSRRRANSVLAYGPSGVDDDLAQVGSWYAARGQRPIAAVLADSPEEQRLRGAGWVPESEDADTVLCLAGVARARRAAARRAPADVGEVRLEELEAGVVTARLDEHAHGRAACEGDWVGVAGMWVDPEHRRSGLGAAVLEALLEWGAERGATTAYLQVLADNAPARALYEGLGFADHHAYRYLTAPTS